MNEQTTWLGICRIVAYLATLLLAVATAISYSRRRQPYRLGLLAGAGILLVIGCLSIVTIFWKDLSWIFRRFGEQLSCFFAVGNLLFATTLLLIAMGRRNQERRIAEMEAILRERATGEAPVNSP